MPEFAVQTATVLAILGLGSAITLWLTSPRSGFTKRAGQRFAIDNLAYIDSEFVGQFDCAVHRRAQATGFGLTAILAGFAAALGHIDDAMLVPGLLGLLITLKALISLNRAGREFRPGPDRPLITRPTAPRTTDYVHPIWLWACLAGTLVAVIAGGLGAYSAFGPGYAYDVPLARSPVAAVAPPFFIAALAALTPAYLIAIARRPTHAVDHPSLYFQDAWRASEMREVCVMVSFACSMTVFQSPLYALSGWAFLTHLGLAFTPMLLWAVAETIGKLRFRKRLWPSLSPKQVLLPEPPVAEPAG